MTLSIPHPLTDCPVCGSSHEYRLVVEVAEQVMTFSSNDADTGPDAAFGLGALLMSQFDDIPSAMSMFRRATASKDPQTAELAVETLQAFS